MRLGKLSLEPALKFLLDLVFLLGLALVHFASPLSAYAQARCPTLPDPASARDFGIPHPLDVLDGQEQ